MLIAVVADSSMIYLIIAIAIITILITTILSVVIWHVCRQRMAKRRFMFLTGNIQDQPRGQDYGDESMYGAGGTPTRTSSHQPSLAPQLPRSKYLNMIKNLSAKKATKNFGTSSTKMKSHKSLHSPKTCYTSLVATRNKYFNAGYIIFPDIIHPVLSSKWQSSALGNEFKGQHLGPMDCREWVRQSTSESGWR
uniref:Uncharacterized protein n=1 Tax=Romanomermis culicivorax TaxID=13658 RepID=A0A915HZZ1_ROMCU